MPASVASYQSISWDLDHAFVALNELANMFQPGIIDVIQQQLVGPNGGAPLNFKQDIFDPLGDRITIISDFKKPIKEDSERMLLAVALEDSKAFQNSLNKLIALTGGQPKKREFQNTTIYDFEMPAMPNAANGGGPGGAAGAVQARGPISVAIAKDTLFVSSEPTLLELVLRGGGRQPGRQCGVQGCCPGNARQGQQHELRPTRRAGPADLRHDQERPVRAGHSRARRSLAAPTSPRWPRSSPRKRCPTSRSSPSTSPRRPVQRVHGGRPESRSPTSRFGKRIPERR